MQISKQNNIFEEKNLERDSLIIHSYLESKRQKNKYKNNDSTTNNNINNNNTLDSESQTQYNSSSSTAYTINDSKMTSSSSVNTNHSITSHQEIINNTNEMSSAIDDSTHSSLLSTVKIERNSDESIHPDSIPNRHDTVVDSENIGHTLETGKKITSSQNSQNTLSSSSSSGNSSSISISISNNEISDSTPTQNKTHKLGNFHQTNSKLFNVLNKENECHTPGSFLSNLKKPSFSNISLASKIKAAKAAAKEKKANKAKLQVDTQSDCEISNPTKPTASNIRNKKGILNRPRSSSDCTWGRKKSKEENASPLSQNIELPNSSIETPDDSKKSKKKFQGFGLSKKKSNRSLRHEAKKSHHSLSPESSQEHIKAKSDSIKPTEGEIIISNHTELDPALPLVTLSVPTMKSVNDTASTGNTTLLSPTEKNLQDTKKEKKIKKTGSSLLSLKKKNSKLFSPKNTHNFSIAMTPIHKNEKNTNDDSKESNSNLSTRGHVHKINSKFSFLSSGIGHHHHRRHHKRGNSSGGNLDDNGSMDNRIKDNNTYNVTMVDRLKVKKTISISSRLSINSSPGGYISDNSSIHSELSNSASNMILKSCQYYNKHNGGMGDTKRKTKLKRKDFSPSLKNLGSGATGNIHLVYRKDDKDKLYAMKEFIIPQHKTSKNSERDFFKQLQSEYTIGTLLHHPNVVEVEHFIYSDYYKCNIKQRHVYQVMEYCNGGDLFDAIHRNDMTQGDIICYFRQLMEGVAYLHSMGVAHRDLKPENVMFKDGRTLKILDFGAAIMFKTPYSNDIIKCSGIVGSEPYMAPEQFSLQSYDPRTVDIWSCGIIFLAMFYNELPWKRAIISNTKYKAWAEKGVSELIQDLPEGPRELISRMLEPDPEKRITMKEIFKNPWFTHIHTCMNYDTEAELLAKGLNRTLENVNSNVSMTYSTTSTLSHTESLRKKISRLDSCLATARLDENSSTAIQKKLSLHSNGGVGSHQKTISFCNDQANTKKEIKKVESVTNTTTNTTDSTYHATSTTIYDENSASAKGHRYTNSVDGATVATSSPVSKINRNSESFVNGYTSDGAAIIKNPQTQPPSSTRTVQTSKTMKKTNINSTHKESAYSDSVSYSSGSSTDVYNNYESTLVEQRHSSDLDMSEEKTRIGLDHLVEKKSSVKVIEPITTIPVEEKEVKEETKVNHLPNHNRRISQKAIFILTSDDSDSEKRQEEDGNQSVTSSSSSVYEDEKADNEEGDEDEIDLSHLWGLDLKCSHKYQPEPFVV